MLFTYIIYPLICHYIHPCNNVPLIIHKNDIYLQKTYSKDLFDRQIKILENITMYTFIMLYLHSLRE